jgi:ABC-type transport system involved in multi-copper enzyme maturation permease subunit
MASLVGLSIVLALLQVAAALPWLLALEIRLREPMRRFSVWAKVLLAAVGVGVAGGLLLESNSDPQVLERVGRAYASILHLQLAGDFFALVFGIVLTLAPKGGAVALSAFREGIRQPMFWLLAGGALVLILASPFFPYFTFGEDLKMVRELGYAITMLFAGLFGVIAASMSISEEIEGRTAVTLMSKPVSRRQFLLGKFGGILMAALFMTVLLGWFLVWIFLFGTTYIRIPGQVDPPPPEWVVNTVTSLFGTTSAADLGRGIGLWAHDAGVVLPGLTIGFCQVMVLLAIAVALATRLPMVVNLVVCMLVYFLGHLTPIMTEVTRSQQHIQERLIYFVAQVFDTVLPGLDLFDVGTAIVREAPLPPLEYGLYTLNVTLYAIVYAAIALLFGLILFEDRDLA